MDPWNYEVCAAPAGQSLITTSRGFVMIALRTSAGTWHDPSSGEMLPEFRRPIAWMPKPTPAKMLSAQGA